jgi:hypothetical protein
MLPKRPPYHLLFSNIPIPLTDAKEVNKTPKTQTCFIRRKKTNAAADGWSKQLVPGSYTNRGFGAIIFLHWVPTKMTVDLLRQLRFPVVY